jgi:hypothetical protein
LCPNPAGNSATPGPTSHLPGPVRARAPRSGVAERPASGPILPQGASRMHVTCDLLPSNFADSASTRTQTCVWYEPHHRSHAARQAEFG